MTRRSAVRSRFAGCCILLAVSLPAFAQPSAPAGDQTPTSATLDTIFWPHAPAHCVFFLPADEAAFRPDKPESWRFQFFTMRDNQGSASVAPVERGYVMKAGLLRELEKTRTGADAEGAAVTVWRSAGEPRINITTTLRPIGVENGRDRFTGTLQTIRGDGRDSVAIRGTCASESSVPNP